MGTVLLWLVTAIQGIFIPLLTWFGKRAVLFTTVIAAFVTLTGVLASTFQSALASAANHYAADTLGISAFVGLILPANFSLLASLCISVSLARFGWEYFKYLYLLAAK